MIKSILLALDETKASETAQQYACELAKKRESLLSAITLIDAPWIIAPELIPIGAIAMKYDVDERTLLDTKKRVHKLEDHFKEFAAHQEVNVSFVTREGDPAYEIEQELLKHDLLVIGKDANFHFEEEGTISESLIQLLKDNPRPLLVVPPAYRTLKRVGIAFDGSLGAARAVHMALLLGFLEGVSVEVFSIEEEPGNEGLGKIQHLLSAHGVEHQAHTIVTAEKPSAVLLKKIEEAQLDLLVMGAYGHGGLLEIFFGATTSTLLKKTTIPLFICH